MADKKYQEIVLALEDYQWGVTNEEAKAALWKDITTILQILMKNQYIAVVRDDDTDIIVIEFEHDERVERWGCSSPVWLTEDEQDMINRPVVGDDWDEYKDEAVQGESLND